MTDLVPATSTRRIVLLAVGALSLLLVVVLSAIGTAQANAVEAPLGLVVAIGAPGIVAAVWLLGGVIRAIGRARDSAIARGSRPLPALVFASNRSAGNQVALAPFSTAAAKRLPREFTVLSEAHGMSFWDGPALDPVQVASIPWAQIVGIRATRVRSEGTVGPGLALDLIGGRAVDLQPLGGGLLGIYPLSASRRDRLLSELEAVRRAATPRSS